MSKLSPGVRRMVALALLIVAIVLPWRLIVQPLQEEFAGYAEASATQQEMLVRYRRLADSRDELRARLAQLQQEPASQEGYLSGESETLVAAELQNMVRSTVERHGGRLESTQILPATIENEFKRVTLRVRMAAGTDALFRIFYDLESMLPYIFVDSLDIIARDRRARRTANEAEDGVLVVNYDVFGYMRSG
jgi:hypothetical protein